MTKDVGLALLVESLSSQLRGSSLDNLSRRIGASPKTTKRAVGAAMSIQMGALFRLNREGNGDHALLQALERCNDDEILEDIPGFIENGSDMAGVEILDHLLGDRQESATTYIARASGIDIDSANTLGILLAPLIMATLGKVKRELNLCKEALAGKLVLEQMELENRIPGGAAFLDRLLDSNGNFDPSLDSKTLGKLFATY